jgi:hypothetical protein
MHRTHYLHGYHRAVPSMAPIALVPPMTRSTSRSTPDQGDHWMPATERYRSQYGLMLTNQEVRRLAKMPIFSWSATRSRTSVVPRSSAWCCVWLRRLLRGRDGVPEAHPAPYLGRPGHRVRLLHRHNHKLLSYFASRASPAYAHHRRVSHQLQ